MGSDSIKGIFSRTDSDEDDEKISSIALPRLNELMSEAGGLLEEVESISIRARDGNLCPLSLQIYSSV